MREVSIDGVLRKGALAPRVSTAYAMNVEVDVQVHETSALDLMRMLGGFQVLLAIIPGTDAEGLEAADA